MKKMLATAFIAVFLLGCTAPVWECFSDSDCPQPKCLGITAKCDYGKCVYINSNGTLAKCSNVSVSDLAEEYCISNGYRYEPCAGPEGLNWNCCYVNQSSYPGHTYKCQAEALYGGICPTCDQFCYGIPHIECVGYRNTSGTFPNCKCQYICSTSIPCTSDVDCPENYSCYNSRYCTYERGVKETCGDQEGDLLCHKLCNQSSDCPSNMPYCRSVNITIGHVVTARKMCMKE
ncbi:MAG: hypothetical protein NTY73_01415 [Candidatus Micrarchaeota archaeon]|nr:hypothetical protein [Candidatus Micrarchaeota archaeon]